MSDRPKSTATAGADAIAGGGDDAEDDYMNMVFTDLPAGPETSLQRRQRERREAELRGRIKSKSELAAEESAKREAALATSLLHDTRAVKKSKGFAMMTKMGFRPGAGLGPEEPQRPEPEPGVSVPSQTPTQPGGAPSGSSSDATAESAGRTAGLLEPVRIAVKEDRGGIGLASERKRKVLEAAGDDAAAKRPKADETEFRDRVRREREVARKESQLHAAQKVAERMNDEMEQDRQREQHQAEKEDDGAARLKTRTEQSSSEGRPLRRINVLWRGLVRAREQAERDRRMRHDLQQSLSRLPTYEDEEEDEDDRRAIGKTATVYVTAEDLDDDDPELDEFNSQDVDYRLQRVVDHLREAHNYCFWCKYRYSDDRLEGCPGRTEEDHD